MHFPKYVGHLQHKKYYHKCKTLEKTIAAGALGRIPFGVKQGKKLSPTFQHCFTWRKKHILGVYNQLYIDLKTIPRFLSRR